MEEITIFLYAKVSEVSETNFKLRGLEIRIRCYESPAIGFYWWLSLSKSHDLKINFNINFFCLETKETKVKDLDSFTSSILLFLIESANLLCRFAEKLKFLLRKSPKLGRKVNGFLCIKFFAVNQKWGFLLLQGDRGGLEEITIFLYVKVSEVN